ncbi:NAD-dependent epimerase/dehydratase family protein [Candidatus Woesearchaeota archaeon]|nr:NAD-dependent epimerase/dehydratase family protein [Candidatus Woesearchaeota archaeon]
MTEEAWRHHNVFITGGPGLLGSSLIKQLLTKKANVIALVRDQVHHSPFYKDGHDKQVTIVKGGVEDYHTVERALNEYEIETVFHLGAQTIVGTALRSPLSTFESNIKGTWNVLEACRQSKMVSRVVVASSDKAYGTQKNLPYTEDAPLQGRDNPYDVSKSCTDLISLSYHKAYGLPVGITRCGNFYGPGDLNWNRIVPDTIRSLYYGKNPVIRSDGTYIRDYVFVDDGAHANITLAENLHRPEIQGNAFNFSTGNKVSVLELVKKITTLFPSTLEPVILNQAKGEIKDQYLSSEKAKRMLNWEAQHTIDQGLVKTIAWYKEFLIKHG